MTLQWKTWPPTAEDKARIERYARANRLLDCDHKEAFTRAKELLKYESDRTALYLALNFCGLVSRLSGDMLFGEAVKVGPDTARQIWDDNDLQTAMWEAAVSGSAEGDAVFKVRYGRRQDWAEGDDPIIEPVPSNLFFPVLNPDNVREMKSAVIAWEVKASDEPGARKYLRREIHEPGVIRNELWTIDGSRLGSQVELATLEQYRDLEEVQPTGYPGLLVFHVPNVGKRGAFWGISDYQDIADINDELNNRMSRIGTILDKHSFPKLLLPPGLMQFDERLGRWYVPKEQLEALEIDPGQSGDLPKYLVWDAQLSAAFQHVDKLVEFLLATGEISPAALGMDSGGIAESGRALRFRLLRTIAKISRKKSYFDRAIKEMLFAAQVLQNVHGNGPKPEPVTLEWADGLPNDDEELADRVNSRVAAGTMSRRRALVVADGLEGDALDEEIAEIERGTVAPSPEVVIEDADE